MDPNIPPDVLSSLLAAGITPTGPPPVGVPTAFPSTSSSTDLVSSIVSSTLSSIVAGATALMNGSSTVSSGVPSASSLPVSSQDGFLKNWNNTNRPAGWEQESRIPLILAGTIIPLAIGTMFVAARVVAKCLGRSWGKDDTLLLLTWCLVFPSGILGVMNVRYGAGKHINFKAFSDGVMSLKFAFAQKIIYRLAIGTTKLSLCASYLRFFSDRASRRITYAIAASTIIYSLVLVVDGITECLPIELSWNPIAQYKCRGSKSGTIATVVLNGVVDVVMIVFTMSRLKDLRVNRRTKNGLLIVANLGWLVLLASILRCVYWFKALSSGDFTWNAGYVTTWSAIELNVGIICASAPYLRLLAVKVAPYAKSLGSSWTGSKNSGSGSGASKRSAGISSSGSGPWSMPSGIGSRQFQSGGVAQTTQDSLEKGHDHSLQHPRSDSLELLEKVYLPGSAVLEREISSENSVSRSEQHEHERPKQDFV